jgi:hypothetical protein
MTSPLTARPTFSTRTWPRLGGLPEAGRSRSYSHQPRVVFYDRNWTEFGTRASLTDQLEKITGIDGVSLHSIPAINRQAFPDVCRGLRIGLQPASKIWHTACWAIFDINMPLLYGEGNKAFMRLQEEIVKVSDDQTIFCWTWSPLDVPTNWTSFLAPSPAVFADSAKFSPAVRLSSGQSSEYAVTNAGLRIELPIASTPPGHDIEFIMLNASSRPYSETRICLPSILSLHQGREQRKRRGPFPPFPIDLPMHWVRPASKLYLDCRSRDADQLFEGSSYSVLSLPMAPTLHEPFK